MGFGFTQVSRHPPPGCARAPGGIAHARLNGPPAPESGAVFQAHAVGARVLRDPEQLLHARLDQVFRFPHDLADRPAREIAAQRRDDAEAAAVIAALRDLEVGVVARRELDTWWRG